MIELEKLHQAMSQVSAEKGDFVLFGLFLREEAPEDKWDLIVSAPWLEEGKLKALGEFVQKIAPIIGEEEMFTFSRIITLNHKDPALDTILKKFKVEDGLKEAVDFKLFDAKFKHVYIFRAVRE